jgi:hypothetical protein
MSTIRFQVEPRDVPPEKAARRMGLTLERFTELLPQLLSRGFPASDPDTGNYDLDASAQPVIAGSCDDERRMASLPICRRVWSAWKPRTVRIIGQECSPISVTRGG